ncbi:crossover junction endonuclease MUS81 [Platysternon megacephalum]|uniref:Crossover junction endonuclease MUS81 n=1 Tax=Platysternon megacephalum TaxID=55544 RepID=A0A4D9EVS7_9SAUR|nr:crossover junction endonuclease MUS81 [Platysternon megacephalum]
MRIMSTSCICPVLVCLCFVQRCYGAAHHGSIKVTRNQTKHIEGETEVHHRPKRGWVWNQFFVLEEHLGPDPQYVGKVRSYFFSVKGYRDIRRGTYFFPDGNLVDVSCKVGSTSEVNDVTDIHKLFAHYPYLFTIIIMMSKKDDIQL